MSHLEKRDLPFETTLTKRLVSEGAEKQLYNKNYFGKTGLVELIDYMGGDDMVERVATLGYGRSIFPQNPDREDFIPYLVNKGVYEPFSSTQLKFHIQSPIFTALTFVYENSINVNEYSGRYSIMLDSSFEFDENYVLNKLEKRDSELAKQIVEIFKSERELASKNYKELIELDMARELARAGLGIDNDTKYFWKIDLLSLSRFVNNKKKLVDGVTRAYLEAVSDIAKNTAPLSWEALTNHKETKFNLTMPRDEDIIDSSLASENWSREETKRVTVQGLEDFLFSRKKFLDYGEFQVVDYMGDDNSFADAARVSYGVGTKTLQDNKNLIRSLIRDLHTSPIEMAEIAFEAKSPFFSDPRQAGRHRTLEKHGFMGYFPLGNQFYMPVKEEFKYQDKLNRQGRGKEMDSNDLDESQKIFYLDKQKELETTKRLRELNAPEDIIRMAKGVGFYTKVWRTGDTHNLGRFLKLRLDSHAQMEVRELAKLIDYAVSLHTPIAHEAINNYLINSISFSQKEIEVIKKQKRLVVDLENLDNYRGADFIIAVDKDDKSRGYKLNREGLAFKKKLEMFLGK